MRYSKWDTLLVFLSLAHGAVLVLAPSVPVIALGLWWNSNTISHNFIHLPFFRSRVMNRVYSAYLSVLLGIPQGVWRARHLAHHGNLNEPPRLRRQTWLRGIFLTAQAPLLSQGRELELGLVGALWAVLVAVNPQFFLSVYVPGYLLGLTLCYIHGHFEHARGVTSNYGLLYNMSFFNDGFHAEHHAAPGAHWTRLPEQVCTGARTSRWPAVARWIENINLEMLERLVLHSKALQRFVLENHERAFRALVLNLSDVSRVKIVGGGLFPRTAIILQRLLPGAEITVIDANAKNIETSKSFLNGNVKFAHEFYEPEAKEDADLVVIPLAFFGNRNAIYGKPPARVVLVHDWMWRKRGESATVSVFLLKRLNLVRG